MEPARALSPPGDPDPRIVAGYPTGSPMRRVAALFVTRSSWHAAYGTPGWAVAPSPGPACGTITRASNSDRVTSAASPSTVTSSAASTGPASWCSSAHPHRHRGHGANTGRQVARTADPAGDSRAHRSARRCWWSVNSPCTPGPTRDVGRRGISRRRATRPNRWSVSWSTSCDDAVRACRPACSAPRCRSPASMTVRSRSLSTSDRFRTGPDGGADHLPTRAFSCTSHERHTPRHSQAGLCTPIAPHQLVCATQVVNSPKSRELNRG